jgi:hypothetical protein
MNLFIAKSKIKVVGSNYPNPKDLINIDFIHECRRVGDSLSISYINNLIKSDYYLKSVNCTINLNDIYFIKDNGFTILWHENVYQDNVSLYWIIFDIDNHKLIEFNREFKLKQILNI